jgi:hypothetical protein
MFMGMDPQYAPSNDQPFEPNSIGGIQPILKTQRSAPRLCERRSIEDWTLP